MTTFHGVGMPTDFQHGPILIIAGDLDTLKKYLGHGPDYAAATQVAVAVGPHADQNAIQSASLAGRVAARKWAETLDGREIGNEISTEEEKELKAAGLIAVIGGGDDLAEFRGVIHDEAGIGKIYFNKKGRFFAEDRIEELEGLLNDGDIDALPAMNLIVAEFGSYHSYKTDIPHSTFTINDGGELYCRGIVFHVSDLK